MNRDHFYCFDFRLSCFDFRLSRFGCRLSRFDFRVALLAGVLSLPVQAQEAAGEQDLFSLSIAELMQVEVSSASRQAEPFADVAASVYVITQSAIRAAGATSIPEALRLAPTLQVARVNASQYAITARGFNSPVSNKLLVMIDGRTVYTPLFSGVFWDHQDVVLEDVDRIEVVSGPGGTLWGSNAVNGVINILTKTAAETVGGLVSLHTGGDQRGISARYGAGLGQYGHMRVYSKWLEQDPTFRINGTSPYDGMRKMQIGFRGDWTRARDHFTLQGDLYDGRTDDRGQVIGIDLGAIEVAGNNLLARWQRQMDNASSVRLQVYWDHMKRRDAVLFQPRGDIFDVEFQHDIPFDAHNFLWGWGYRYGKDDVDPGFFATFIPDSREQEWKSGFIQDEYSLTSKLKATAGIKFEHNEYTGLEVLPSARLAWKYSADALVWSAVSRAVRAPSRLDRDVYYPAPPNSVVVGGPNFESEVADVLELGFRHQIGAKLLYSATAYYHNWDKLRSGSRRPVQMENNIEGEVSGLEIWANYDLTDRWKWSVGGMRLNKELRLKPGGGDPVGVDNPTLANDPKYRVVLRSTYEFSDRTLLQIGARHTAALPHPRVPAFTSIDCHFAWRFRRNWEASATLYNLADQEHREFGEATSSSEFGRTGWLRISWQE